MILSDRGLDGRIQEMGLSEQQSTLSKDYSREKAMKVEHNRV